MKIIIFSFIVFSMLFLFSMPSAYASVIFHNVQICDIGSFSITRSTAIICRDFTTPVDEPSGGAGGVGAIGVSIPDPLGLIILPEPLSITLSEPTQVMALGGISSDQIINVEWNSDKDLVVNSISYEGLPFNLKVQDTPFVLKGDPDGSSSGQIFYSIQAPVEECIGVQTDDCAYLVNYNIDLAVEFEHDGEMFPRKTGIFISLGITSPILTYLATIILGSIIIGLFIAILTKDKKKRNRKYNRLDDGAPSKKKFSFGKPKHKPIERKIVVEVSGKGKSRYSSKSLKYEPIERKIVYQQSSKNEKPRYSLKDLKSGTKKRQIRFKK